MRSRNSNIAPRPPRRDVSAAALAALIEGQPATRAIELASDVSGPGLRALGIATGEDMLTALEADNEYLQAGGVFPLDLIETWIDYKRTNEVDPIRLRPHPHEFELYYDI